MAQRLAEAGIPIVIGMAYTVTVSAAEKVMPAFYRNLASGKAPAEAIKIARRLLSRRPERVVGYGQQIDLQDWLVPVVFQQQENLELRLPGMNEEELSHYHSKRARAGPEPRKIIGRDFDVLAVERLLLAAGAAGQVLITGGAGVGKTALVTRLLKWWWLSTGLVDEAFVFSFDEGTVTARHMVHKMAAGLLSKAELPGFRAMPWDAQLDRVNSVLRARHFLIVVDTGARSMTDGPGALSPADQHELHRLLTHLRGGNSLVVVTSRRDEAWLAEDTFDDARYQLPALAEPAASSLSGAMLGPARIAELERRPAESEALRQLVVALDGNPARIEEVLPAVASMDPSTVLRTIPGRPPDAPEPPPSPDRPGISRRVKVLGVVLVLAVLAIALAAWPSGRQKLEPPPVSPTAGQSLSPAPVATADPSWVTGPVGSGVVITEPADQAKVSACFPMRGTVRGLGADQTLLVAIRNTTAYAGAVFYLIHVDLDGGNRWSVQVAAGKSVDQDYDVYVLIADRKSADQAFAAAQGSPTTALTISGLRRAAHLRVHQNSVLNLC